MRVYSDPSQKGDEVLTKCDESCLCEGSCVNPAESGRAENPSAGGTDDASFAAGMTEALHLDADFCAEADEDAIPGAGGTDDARPALHVFTPYRICPVGAHSDHQLGKITGFAIDKGIHLYYNETADGSISLCSLQFANTPVFWENAALPPAKQGDWADYLRGAALYLGEKYPLHTGISGIFAGELPIGGLSSSAALVLSFLSALCRANGLAPDEEELITLAQKAENVYVGVASGRLDQSCEVYSRKNKLLYMDLQTKSRSCIAAGPGMKPWKLAIFFSGLERSLAGTAFNMRVDECRAAAYALKAYAGLPYGKFGETNLREVPYEVYLQYKDRLPQSWAKRAAHWYGEYFRVQAAVKAWQDGDIEAFGRISFESGRSSIENWETGSEQLIALYEIMTQTEGIYGGRFSGAGFKGCCMAMIDPAREESVLRTVEERYLQRFPELKGKYSACCCETADGIGAEKEALL